MTTVTHGRIKRVFTQKVGLQFSHQSNGNGTPVLGVDLFAMKDGKANFDEKVAVQLSDDEYSAFFRVLLLIDGQFETKFHGNRNDKLLRMSNNPNGDIYFFMREHRKDLQKEIVVPASYRYELTINCGHIMAVRDGVSVTEVLAVIKSLASREKQLNGRAV